MFSPCLKYSCVDEVVISSCLFSYDINSETLRVTLLGANHLRPRDPLEVMVNARVSVTVERRGTNKQAVQPRPKLSMLNKLASNQNMASHLNGGQKTTGKTYTTDASSSSIYWRTRKPVWNENFFFDVCNFFSLIKSCSRKVYTLVRSLIASHVCDMWFSPVHDRFFASKGTLSRVKRCLAFPLW